jgi:hypothetical protein
MKERIINRRRRILPEKSVEYARAVKIDMGIRKDMVILKRLYSHRKESGFPPILLT